MPVQTLYEEVEDILTNRLKNALRAGENINAPDWVSDLPDNSEIPKLRQFAHQKRDELIVERTAEKT